uniref:Uncharacterized protein n=1 Tax=Rhizophora mucronata TaxID=61149 RepID=A0A2P2P810_RHIMU
MFNIGKCNYVFGIACISFFSIRPNYSIAPSLCFVTITVNSYIFIVWSTKLCDKKIWGFQDALSAYEIRNHFSF